MAKKKNITASPKGEVTEPKLDVEKIITNPQVDDISRIISKLTYGQCSVLKIALDRRLAATRARKR